MIKNKKGFTLIELLAVIIILGILMIIAIPSVTQYINNSRKSAYVDTAKEIIAGARNLVNQGDLEMFDTEVTYYIDYSCISTENGSKSPYGDFEKAYVVVTYDGKSYSYYWTSVDETGQGVKSIIRADKLDEDYIDSDLSDSDISTLRGIDEREKSIVISKSNNCEKEDPTDTEVQINGEDGSVGYIAYKKISTSEGIVELAGAKRFVGNDPNNYVLFNGDEVWRIIGVYGNNLKIIKLRYATTRSCGCTENHVNWGECTLTTYLNETYYNSMTDKSHEMIENGTWYIGETGRDYTAEDAYESAQSVEYSANVGLLATYEYLYNADESCRNIDGYHFYNCDDRGWLFQSSFITSLSCSRTMTFMNYSNYSLHVNFNDGTISTGYAPGGGVCDLHPVVYLKSSTKIVGGNGTSSNPYKLDI